MKHLIVGTAGHIDHGKSALVKALTDIDPDRLKEEKERGLTIDLGFAYFDLPDGTRVGFVDVPGHERFVRNMLAGAAGVDIVILVIDATESVMPQTREHLDIMKLLGIARGIVAITKIDLADDEMIEIVEAEVEELVENTFLEGAPVVKVSSTTGEGMEEVKRLIASAVSDQQQKREDGLFRFPIDRVFTMKGFGTVVTGTVFSGQLAEDEEVLILPAGLSSRARQLQSHNVKQDRISAGMRASLNLTHMAVQQLNRGDTLVRAGTIENAHMLDVKVRLLESAPRTLARNSVIKLYVATSQILARMILVDNKELKPGSESYAQIRLSQPLCVFRGDRFVIRAESPEFTIGGGTVLDTAPVKYRHRDKDRPAWLQTLETADPEAAAMAFLDQRKLGAKLQEIAARTCEPLERVRSVIDDGIQSGTIVSSDAADDILLLSSDNFNELCLRLANEVKSYFKSQPHRLFMPREELRSRLGSALAPVLFEKAIADLAASGELAASSEGVSLKGRQAQVTDKQMKAKQGVETLFREAGLSPPTFSQAEEQFEDRKGAKLMTSLLIEEGTLVKISPTFAYHKDILDDVFARIRGHFQQSDKLGVGDLKTILGVSRKHAVPLLEYCDKIGLTTRVGDHRVLKTKTAK